MWLERGAAGGTARLAERQASLGGVPLSFDKDDVLACEMVAAAALLRGANYGIPGQSLFAAKGMAGNIIHAIATTNAIISVTQPILRRQPRKKSPIIQAPSFVVGSGIFSGDGLWGLLSSRYAENSVSGMTIDQYGMQ